MSKNRKKLHFSLSKKVINYKNKSSLPVGYVDQLTMNSLSFKEFIVNLGVSKDVIDILKSCYLNKTSVPEALNNKMFEYLNLYLLIGGMPEAVKIFKETNNLNLVYKTNSNIISLYSQDITLYADSNINKIKIQSTFNSIHKQLSQEYTKFKFSLVKKDAKRKDYINATDWIEKAGYAVKCYNLKKIELPYNLNSCEQEFKLYFKDIGLLTSFLDNTTKLKLYNAELHGSVLGGIYENLVADLLIKKDYDYDSCSSTSNRLYYYKNKNSTCEIEFIQINENNLLKNPILPIEVKKSNNRTISLDNILNQHQDIEYGIKLIKGNVGYNKEKRKLTLPLYMAMFL